MAQDPLQRPIHFHVLPGMKWRLGPWGCPAYTSSLNPFSPGETVDLSLVLEPTCPKPGQNSWSSEMTNLLSGLNEAQVLGVSSQKEFSESQSGAGYVRSGFI